MLHKMLKSLHKTPGYKPGRSRLSSYVWTCFLDLLFLCTIANCQVANIWIDISEICLYH